MDDYSIGPIFQQLYDEEDIDLNNLVEYDKRKSYTTSIFILKNEILPIITPGDKLKKYKIRKFIRPGFYFVAGVMTKFKIYIKPGLYPHFWVNYCLDNGLITDEDIKYEIITQRCYKLNKLAQAIEKIYEIYGIDFGKKIVNLFVGCMNIKYNKKHYH